MQHKNRLTVKLLKAALKKQQRYVDHFTTCDQRRNPQVVEMRLIATGSVVALQAVLDAMHGDRVSLLIMGSNNDE